MKLSAELCGVVLMASAVVIGCGGSATDPAPPAGTPGEQSGAQPGAQPGAQSPPDVTWCPAVAGTPSSYAEILADFPLPFADAESGAFRACRNDECYSLSLSALSAENGPSPASVTGLQNGAPGPNHAVQLSVEVWADREVIGVPKPASAPPTPYLKLRWDHTSDPTDFTRTDEYTLSVDPDSSGITSLLDTMVTYERTTYTDLYTNMDPALCGVWGVATVDLRAVR